MAVQPEESQHVYRIEVLKNPKRKKYEKALWEKSIGGAKDKVQLIRIAEQVRRVGHKVRVVDEDGARIYPITLPTICEKMPQINIGDPVILTEEFWDHLKDKQGLDIPSWIYVIGVGLTGVITDISEASFSAKFPVAVSFVLPDDEVPYENRIWYGVAERMRQIAYAYEQGFTPADYGDWYR